MMKDIQENMNSLYDGPFQTGSMIGQRTQGVGGAQQGRLYFAIHKVGSVVLYGIYPSLPC